MLHTQIREGAALIDAEQQLIRVNCLFFMLQTVHLRLAAQQPARRAGAAVFGIFIGCRVFNTLIKGHGNGGAQISLNLHALLRAHKDPVSVQMRVEGHAFLGDLAQLGQTEHLKPAAVRQDGAVPFCEFVQAAHIGHQLITRTQMQMIGVAQHDLCADILEIQRRKTALDGSGRGNILERGGLYRTVDRGKLTAAGGTFLFDKAVRHRYYLHFIYCPKKAAQGAFPRTA